MMPHTTFTAYGDAKSMLRIAELPLSLKIQPPKLVSRSTYIEMPIGPFTFADVPVVESSAPAVPVPAIHVKVFVCGAHL